MSSGSGAVNQFLTAHRFQQLSEDPQDGLRLQLWGRQSCKPIIIVQSYGGGDSAELCQPQGLPSQAQYGFSATVTQPRIRGCFFARNTTIWDWIVLTPNQERLGDQHTVGHQECW